MSVRTMPAPHILIERKAVREPNYVWWVTKRYLRFAVPQSKLALVGLISVAVAIAKLNRFGASQVRAMFDSIEEKVISGYEFYFYLSLTVFCGSAMLAFTNKWIEEGLGATLREKLSLHLLPMFCKHRTVVAGFNDECSQYVDQWLTDYVKIYAQKALSYAVMGMNCALSLYFFVPALWAISPKLFWIAVTYAFCGSLLAWLIARSLDGLQKKLYDKEAQAREANIELKKLGGSDVLALRLAKEVCEAQRRLIRPNRNLTGFNSLYDYFKGYIPILIVVPVFFAGGEKFGVISESIIAFGFVVNSISVVVKEMGGIIEFTAIASRIGLLWKRLEDCELKSN